MRNIRLLAVITFLLIAASCRESSVTYDYRLYYVGYYSFTDICDYSGPYGEGVDTLYYEGLVRCYADQDSSEHFVLDDASIPSGSKIVIQMDEKNKTFTVLNEDGTFVTRTGTDFKQSGRFNKRRDSLFMFRHVSPDFDDITHTIIGVRHY